MFFVGSEDSIDEATSASSKDCFTLLREKYAKQGSADTSRGKKMPTSTSNAHLSAPTDFDSYTFEQPTKRRKYVTKKSTEHNDAAAVLSLAPLIEVIGSSLDLEAEGEQLEAGTAFCRDDTDRDWERGRERDGESSGVEAVGDMTCPTSNMNSHPHHASCEGSTSDRSTAGSDEEAIRAGVDAVPRVSPQLIENISMPSVEEKREDGERQYFRAELLLLTMRTPSLTSIQT